MEKPRRDGGAFSFSSRKRRGRGSRRRGDWCLLLAGARARLTQGVELLLELDLHSPLHRLVIDALAHGVREPGLVQCHATGRIVVVLVSLRVTRSEARRV